MIPMPDWVPWIVGAAFFFGSFLTAVLWGLYGAAGRGDETEERYGFEMGGRRVMESVFCPECQKQGLKSRVYPSLATESLMYCPPFYDEEGRLHHHDLNTHTQAFTCSNGHSWQTKTGGSCWCGWPNEEEA